MSSINPDEESTIFDEVVDLQTKAERDALLELRCGSNVVLRRRIESLLTAYAKSEYLEARPSELLDLSRTTLGLVGSRVGPFDILELIGQGGMGEVYLARSVNEPGEFVAMKVIKAGLDTHQVTSRFNLERSILHGLDHPNIARFVESGIADCGRAYFAMEWVQGIAITDYCDRQRLSIDDRLLLFIDVCAAVDHVHNLGVVHRDLKPQNVLVMKCDGKAVVKVIDFGIAKALTDEAGRSSCLTGPIQCLGSPRYISPEQMNWSSDIDARADVYSLGVVLYELITGMTPRQLEGTQNLDFQHIHAEVSNEELKLPSQRVHFLTAEKGKQISDARATEKQQLIRRLSRELDWITAKAMERERECRYASAAELVADLRAHLEHRPISAHAPTWALRWRKWSKRNARLVSLAGGVSVLVCILGLAFGLMQVVKVAREESKLANEKFVHSQFVHDMQTTSDLLRSGDSNSARKLLDMYSSQSGNPFANHFAAGYLRGLIPEPVQSFAGHKNEILDMDLSNDGRWMVSGDRGGDIIIWDCQAGREVLRLNPNDKEVTRVRFSPSGNLLATAGQDRLVRLWKIEDWSLVGELDHHEFTINGLDWSPDGMQIASGDRKGNVCIWSEQTRSLERMLSNYAGPVRCLEWSPDGRQLAIADGNRGIRILNTESWSETGFVDSYGIGTLAIAFSADSQLMASGGYGGEMVITEVKTHLVVSRIKTHEQIWSLSFGGNREIIAGEGTGHIEIFNKFGKAKSWQSIRVWDSGTSAGRIRSVALSHLGGRDNLVFAVDKRRAIFVVAKSAISGNEESEQTTFQIGPVAPLNLFVCADKDHLAFIRSSDEATELTTLPILLEGVCSPAYSASKNVVAIAGGNGGAYVFRADNWQLVSALEFPNELFTMSFSRDGNFLALGGANGAIRIWDLEKRTYHDMSPLGEESPAFAAYSQLNDFLIIGCNDSCNLTCLNSRSLVKIRTIELLPCKRVYVDPCRDFAVVCHQGSFSVWTVDFSEKLWAGVASEAEEVMSVSITSDQEVMAILLRSGMVDFWDLRTRLRLFSSFALLSDTTNQWLAFQGSNNLLVGSALDRTLFSFRAKR